MMNDILKPHLVWIEGRCYRVNDHSVEVTSLQEHDSYENDTYDDEYDDGGDEDVEVVMMDSSRYRSCLHVSKHYLGSIIGKKGAIKLRIQRDTNTELKIPKHGQDGDVVIYGPSESSVKAARRRINIIVMSSRMKQKATHFISIPMNNPDVIKRYEKFEEAVLRDCSSRGLEKSIFIGGQKLHLTIGVMCLMDNEERSIASNLLNQAKNDVVMPILQEHLPLKIRLKGLSYMNDDPSEIDVLYGLVEEEGNTKGLIQEVSDALVDFYYKAGYMEKEHGRENVKLHVTLINSKYRNNSDTSLVDDQGTRVRQPRIKFDGTEILEKFADYDFGVVEMNSIHLSQRHSTGPDGYFQPTCVINLQ